MSRRELKALKPDSQRVIQTHLRSREHRVAMSQQEAGGGFSEDQTEECDLRARLTKMENQAAVQQVRIAQSWRMR